jgi:malonyl-CoA O-methyltransferase
MPVLAVIPSDPMSAYEAVGCHVWAREYYNPANSFDKVYLLSPLEKEEREQYGMITIPTKPKELAGRLVEKGVDILRAYGGYWACDMACDNKAKGIPVVVSVHDTKPSELHDSIRRADYVFCMSEAVRDLVLTRRGHPERVWILPNRYDGRVMRPKPGVDFSDLNRRFPWKRRLLCVGRLSEQKNQDNMIRALRVLGPDYGCVFVGRNEPTQLEKLARELGVESQIQFVESVRNDELARWYNWCDAMATPSRWEGFGIVFIEALACGAVVVTSNTRPMSEYIRHGKNGLLVDDFENPAALAATIRLACEDGELRSRIKAAAPASVGRFEKEKVDALEAGYYQRILAESRCEASQRGPARKILRKLTGEYIKPGAPVELKCAMRAMKWARYFSLPEGGIVHSPQLPVLYPEVAGYYIPTLLALDELDLAEKFAARLVETQNADGSWNGVLCDVPYTFDTGQVLKGLWAFYEKCVSEPKPKSPEWTGGNDAPVLRESMLRGCDWMLGQISAEGRVTTPDTRALHIPGGGFVPEAFYLYTLRPLMDIGGRFDRGEYVDAAQRALAYYLRDTETGLFNTLSHFHAYVVEALIELGELDRAARAMAEIAKYQRSDGAVPAWPDVKWVCSTGLAQYALCWLRLGERERAERAFLWLCSRQNPSGGFFGSYGEGAVYFPQSEISWAGKFFLDAFVLLNRKPVPEIAGDEGGPNG